MQIQKSNVHIDTMITCIKSEKRIHPFENNSHCKTILPQKTCVWLSKHVIRTYYKEHFSEFSLSNKKVAIGGIYS